MANNTGISRKDFIDYLKNFRNEFINSNLVKKYLLEKSQEDFIKFTSEFWDNPIKSTDELKYKYNIDREILYVDILKAFYNEVYLDFLEMVYCGKNTLEDISIKFLIPENKIEELAKPIIIRRENKICPKCFNDSFMIEDELEQIIDGNYKYKCMKCDCKLKYQDLVANKEYKKCQSKTEIINAIRIKEKKKIEELLHGDEFKYINIIKEDIIKVEENKYAIEFICEICDLNELPKWEKIFGRVRLCNRLEKKLLIYILELIKDYNKSQIFTFSGNRVLFAEYCPNSPIVMEIIEKTKIITVRNIMRNIVNKGLIVVNEEHNCILVLPELIENIEKIKETLKVQSIDEALRYSVIKSNNYTCSSCGETGRPLKIAFISANKKKNDFHNMIVLCDNCFEVMTKNDVVIQATLTLESDHLFNNSWMILDFVKYYFPQLSHNNEIKKSINRWEENYTYFNIIKALAITTDKIEQHKLGDSSQILTNYIEGILESSNETKSQVIVSESIFNRYSLNKWMEEI